jgi:hypothetical protein
MEEDMEWAVDLVFASTWDIQETVFGHFRIISLNELLLIDHVEVTILRYIGSFCFVPKPRIKALQVLTSHI